MDYLRAQAFRRSKDLDRAEAKGDESENMTPRQERRASPKFAQLAADNLAV